MVASGLATIALAYLPVSLWVMLSSCEIVCAALLAPVFLRQTKFAFHWAGICISILGIMLVGIAGLGGTSINGDADGGSGSVLFGVILRIAGFSAGALKMIL